MSYLPKRGSKQSPGADGPESLERSSGCQALSSRVLCVKFRHTSEVSQAQLILNQPALPTIYSLMHFADDSDMTKRVLIIDDERLVADTLNIILKRAGFESTAFYDASSALRWCNSYTPDVIVSDVVMPGMNGLEMAVRMKSQFPNCRIILISGQAVTADLAEEFKVRGHNFDILPKPLHPQQLISLIGEHGKVQRRA